MNQKKKNAQKKHHSRDSFWSRLVHLSYLQQLLIILSLFLLGTVYFSTRRPERGYEVYSLRFGRPVGDPKAKLYFLGEVHSVIEDEYAIFIDKVGGRKAQTVYIEGVPFGSIVPCQDYYVKEESYRTCKGWDINESENQKFVDLHGAYTIIISGLEIGLAKLEGPVNRSGLEKVLKEMLSGIQHPQYSGTSRLSAFDKALIRSAPLAEKIIKELLFQLAKGSSPGQISFEFERRLESFGRERANWVMQNLAHRNTYLVKAIREARASPEKVAFFIAGVAHLLPTETTPDEALEPVTREIVRKQDWALLCMDDPKIKRKHPLMKQLESEPESEVAHDI